MVYFIILELPAIVTITPLDISDGPCMTFDGIPMVEALQKLEKEGAACVGLNCTCGPETMVPLIREIRPHIKVRRQHKLILTSFSA